MRPDLTLIKRIHCLGIGGIGLSALVKLFVSQGKTVSGSDQANSELLEKIGKIARVTIGHSADNLPAEFDLLIHSSAISKDNPEWLAAKDSGVPILDYHEAIGLVSQSYHTIVVCGSHGKSTTTALVGKIFESAGLDPTVIVGSKVPGFDDNFRYGHSQYLIVEGDEFKFGIDYLFPQAIVLTNLEADHLDCYGTFENLVGHFQQLIDRLPINGQLIYRFNDNGIRCLDLRKVKNKKSFGQIDSDYQLGPNSASQLEINGRVYHHRLSGEYNRLNITAAVALAKEFKISDQALDKALKDFKGIWRRFELIARRAFNKPVILISDYAHHPTEIKAVIQATQEKFDMSEVLVVFQPHHYDRTARFFDEFVKALKPIKHLIVVEVFDVPGRQNDGIKTVNSQDIVDCLNNSDQSDALYAADLDQAEILIKTKINRQKVVLFIGAGDIDQLARRLKQSL